MITEDNNSNPQYSLSRNAGMFGIALISLALLGTGTISLAGQMFKNLNVFDTRAYAPDARANIIPTAKNTPATAESEPVVNLSVWEDTGDRLTKPR